jgi:hypothetical protein
VIVRRGPWFLDRTILRDQLEFSALTVCGIVTSSDVVARQSQCVLHFHLNNQVRQFGSSFAPFAAELGTEPNTTTRNKAERTN